MIKKLLMLVVCVAVVAALVPSYVGAASPSEVSEYDIAKTGVGAGIAQEQEYTEAINKLERFLSISETGNIVLNAPKGIVNSIDSEVYQSLLAGIEQTNSMIDSGYLVCNPDFTLTVTEKYLESSGQYLEPNSQLIAEGNAVYLVEGIQALSSSGGITAIYFYWWGLWIYLSDGACDAIVYALTTTGITASGLAAILAVGGITIPGAIAAIIVGMLAGIGAATIDYVNRNNTGIKIRIHYICPVPTYIGPQ